MIAAVVLFLVVVADVGVAVEVALVVYVDVACL